MDCKINAKWFILIILLLLKVWILALLLGLYPSSLVPCYWAICMQNLQSTFCYYLVLCYNLL